MQSAAAKRGLAPGRLIGEHAVQFAANELLSFGNWETVVDRVSASLFRKLEQKQSTIELIDQIDKKLDLKITPARKDAALPYLELRHLLVHADGIADADFCARFPKLAAKSGEAVALRFDVIATARDRITDLVQEFDQRALAVGACHPDDIHPIPPKTSVGNAALAAPKTWRKAFHALRGSA